MTSRSPKACLLTSDGQYSNLRLHACTLHHQIVLVTDTILPVLVIVLVDPSEFSVVIDLKHHEDVALEIFTSGLDSNVSIGSNEIVCVSADPYLLKDCTCRSRDDSLRRDCQWKTPTP